MSFDALGLSPDILKALSEEGYKDPTPIQAQAIPEILQGHDVVGLAKTGTGKTGGFLFPLIDILSRGRARARMPRSLVLIPTRELAAQVWENMGIYGRHTKLTKALIVGGESMPEQQKVIERGVDVLIATPGRLMDLKQRGGILMNDIHYVVIDEADRMLDMGFIPDIEKILAMVPPKRQTLLFSATMPPEIEKMAQRFLRNPKRIMVSPPASPAETVDQKVFIVRPDQKKKMLLGWLRCDEFKNAFVFCNRKRDVDSIASYLRKEGVSAAPLHGDMVQKERTQTLNDFKDGTIKFLVCSDVAARGLDIEAVSHVVNYDVPFNADDYIHRIGRTGRAGQTGEAYMLATEDERELLDAIEKKTGRKLPIQKEAGGGSAPSPREERQSEGHRARVQKSHEKRPQPQKSKSPQQQSKPDKRDDDDDAGNGFGDDVPAFFRI
ncbi:MAG: DEAD/DEAH box helicase [Alphaproteobacteria bacterium]|nr:DEAD/DEAH box helicase [Alphaproteobacteria bacterium]